MNGSLSRVPTRSVIELHSPAAWFKEIIEIRMLIDGLDVTRKTLCS